jgi:gliding motility-associated-like protein
MKLIYSLSIFLLFPFFSGAQCPIIQSAMINACAAASSTKEGINEFVLFTTTASATAGAYTLFYGNSTPPKPDAGSNAMEGTRARTKNGPGTITSTNGCIINQVTSPATIIPSGSKVIFIPSDFDATYDVTGICTTGSLYVVYIDISITPVTGLIWNPNGTFGNSPGGSNRYLQITNGGSNCNAAIRTYDGGWGSNADGNVVWWDGTGSPDYQNNGCSILTPPLPTITPSSIAAVCQGAAASVTMAFTTTNNPNRYSLDWNNAANAAGFTDVTNAALTSSPLTINIPAAAVAATYTGSLVVTNSSSGASSVPQNISVTIKDIPVIIKQPDNNNDNLCQNGIRPPLPVSVTATAPSGTLTYQWYVNSTPTIIGASLISGAILPTYQPPYNVADTSYYFCLVGNSNGCADTSDLSGAVIVNPEIAIPTASVTQQPTCASPTGTITVTAPTGSSIEYSNGGVYQSGAVFTGLTPGATYTITARNSLTGCTSQGINILLNNTTGAPAAPIVADKQYCQNDPSTALTATGTGLRWYDALTGGNEYPTAPTPLTNLAGTTDYYVSQTVTSCESPRAKITIRVTASLPVTAFAYSPDAVCANDPTPPLLDKDPAFTAGGAFSAKPAGLSISVFTGAINIALSTPGIYKVYYTISASGCRKAGKDSTTFTISPTSNPVTGFSYTPVANCSNGGNPAINKMTGFTTGGTFSASAAGLRLDPLTGVVDVAASTLGDYVVTYTVAASGCAPAGNAKAPITISGIPTVNAVADQKLCNGTPTAVINFTGTGLLYKWTNDKPSVGLAAGGTGNIASFTAVNIGTLPDTANIEVTPIATNAFAYVPNTGSNNISVINSITKNLVTTIALGDNPVGVAISPDGKRVYVTNKFTQTVSVINAITNTVIGSIPVNFDPFSLAVSPDGSRLYVANSIANNVVVVNTATNTSIATITSNTTPRVIAVSPDGEKIYVTNAGSASISVISTATNTVTTTIPTGANPYGISISADGNRLYVANVGANTITVFNTANNSLIATIPVGTNPIDVALNADGTRLYVANEFSNNVSVINTATNTVIATISVGQSPSGISITPDGTQVYVTNRLSNNVSIINTSSNAVSGTIPVGTAPTGYGDFVSSGATCDGVPVKFKIIVNPTPIAPTLNVTDNCGNSTVTASNVTGSLTWSDAGTGNPRTVTAAGTFTVTQTVNGCISPASNSVTAAPKTIPTAPTLSITDNCGNSTITASNFTGSLTWSDGGTGNPRTATAGTFTVTQTINGCTSTASNTVTAAPKTIPTAPALSVVDNCGTTSTITASGFTGSLTWSDAGTGNPRTVAAGTYSLTQTVNGCISPASNSVTAAPKKIPTAPTLTVVDNCGNSTITASNFTGTLTWSDAGTGNPRTVTSGTFTVTQTVNGCTSPTSNAVTASPKIIPTAPTLTVVDNCGNSTITASNFTGSLIWSDAGTGNPRTVTAAGAFTVTQTINGCTSTASNTVTAAPKTIPTAPTLSVVNNCGTTSTITAFNFTGTLIWSDAGTGNPRTVAAGTYSLTQTVNGCISPASNSVTAAPKTIPTAPTLTVVDNCGNSTITASNFTGTLTWSDAGTGNPRTVTSAGAFTVTQTVNGCTSTASNTVAASPKSIPRAPILNAVNNCGPGIVTLSSTSNGIIKWYSDSQLINLVNTGKTFSPSLTSTTVYYVTATENTCTSITATLVTASINPVPDEPLTRDTSVCNNDEVTIDAGNYASYRWNTGSLDQTIRVGPGRYTVEVGNKEGCKITGSIIVSPEQGCSDIYFPSAFSPDGLNRFFGPLSPGGNLSVITKYSLNIYNRYGQIVFSATNPSQKWDGTFNGKKMGNNSFVWYASYVYRGRINKKQKGTVIIVR